MHSKQMYWRRYEKPLLVEPQTGYKKTKWQDSNLKKEPPTAVGKKQVTDEQTDEQTNRMMASLHKAPTFVPLRLIIFTLITRK